MKHVFIQGVQKKLSCYIKSRSLQLAITHLMWLTFYGWCHQWDTCLCNQTLLRIIIITNQVGITLLPKLLLIAKIINYFVYGQVVGMFNNVNFSKMLKQSTLYKQAQCQSIFYHNINIIHNNTFWVLRLAFTTT